MRIKNNGNIGIGTTAPATKLEVSSGGADVNTIRASYDTNNYLEIAHNRISAASSGTDAILFQTSGTNRAIINTTGLGIGTTSPVEKLTIQSGNINFMGGTNDAHYIKFGDSDDANIGEIFYYHGNNNMVFVTNTSEAMRIDSSGKVGIGTSSPDATLRIDNESGVALKVTGGAGGTSIASFVRDVGANVSINVHGDSSKVHG